MSDVQIFDYKSPAEFLRVRIAMLGVSDRKIASTARIHPAYLSRYFKGQARLSSDQLFQVGQVLSLDSQEQTFLRLLGEWESASNHGLKLALHNEIEAIRQDKLKIANRIKGPSTAIIHPSTASPDHERLYYGSPLTAKVHMLLTIKRFRKTPSLIASDLKITREQFNRELIKLEKLGIITRRSGDIQLANTSIHLDEIHPLCKQNHINWRLDSIQNLSQMTEGKIHSDELHLSVAFTSSRRLREEARKKFQEYIVWLRQSVAEDEKRGLDESLGVLIFDLYES